MQHCSTPSQNFYRRKLPPSCISFASPEGKKLFIESLVKVMVLNALEVDPGRVWKSPWRFYHESMLDCCVSLDEIRRTGITLTQFVCLAECNKLFTELKYAQSKSEFLSTFRENVKRCMAVDDTVLVISYNRQVLGQTGAGHFSPLGAYHEESDQVLIMDVARFKYPPHWVPLTILKDAMLSIDNTTGKPRGYLMLKFWSHMQPLVFFHPQGDITPYKTLFAPRLKKWEQFLAEKALDDEELDFETSCSVFSALFIGHTMFCDLSEIYQSQQESKCHNNCSDMQLMKQTNSRDHICRKISSLDTASYITSTALCVLLLAWPLQETASERIRILKTRLENDLSKLDEKALAEVMRVRQQIQRISNACKDHMAVSGRS